MLHPLAYAEEKTAQQLFSEAWELYQKNPSKTSEVIPLLKEALKKDPNHLEAIKLLSIAYIDIQQYDSAISLINSILKNSKSLKTKLSLYLIKAQALFDKGSITQASDILISLEPEFQKDENLKGMYQSLRSDINKSLSEIISLAKKDAHAAGYETKDCREFVLDKYRKQELSLKIPFKLFLTSQAYQNDWWVVIFLPKNEEKAFAVYLNKHSKKIIEHQLISIVSAQGQNLAEIDMLSIATTAFEHAEKLGYFLGDYMFIVLDKQTPPDILADNSILPCISKEFRSNNWFAVIIFPMQGSTQPSCIYIDIKTYKVAAQKWEQSIHQVNPATITSYKLTGWQTGQVKTEGGKILIGLQPAIEKTK